VRLAVAGGDYRDVSVEARLLELLLEGVRLRLRLEGRNLYRPEAGRVRLRPYRGAHRRLRLLDNGLAVARVRIRRWRRFGTRDGVRLGFVLGALRGVSGATTQGSCERLVERELLVYPRRRLDVGAGESAPLPGRHDLPSSVLGARRDGAGTIPLASHEHAQREGEPHDDSRSEDKRDPLEPAGAALDPSSWRTHMLSGAETPRRPRPLRTTWPIAAESPSRASVSGWSSVITRWDL